MFSKHIVSIELGYSHWCNHVQSSSSSELAAPVALQTPTHTFNLNLTRDQYADLIESLQCLNQQAQSQQPSLIALGRRIDAQLHPQQRTSLHPHRQAQAVPRRETTMSGVHLGTEPSFD